MVEKLDINNEIILMKKSIQQSKICIINKLVKKLRIIKKTLETSEKNLQNLKFTARKDKLTEQIKYLQHTSNVELARQCLITEKSSKQILTNGQSKNEDIALAHLSEFKIIKQKINLIKEKYNLNDDNVTDWRTMVQEVGKKKKKKISKAENAERNAKRKEAHKKEKDLENKRLEWLENNGEKVNSDEKDTDEESGGVDQEDVSDVDDADQDIDADPNDDDDTNDEDSDENNIKTIVTKPTPIKKVSKIKIVKNEHVKLKSSVEINKIKPKTPLTMDSFFITETGHGYMANSAEERIQPVIIHKNDGLDRRKRRAQQFNAVTKNTSSVKPNQNRKPIEKFNKPPQWNEHELNNKKPKIEMTKFTIKPTSSTSTTTELENNAKLHPSWAAKQKLKPTISDFKGTKITFDD